MSIGFARLWVSFGIMVAGSVSSQARSLPEIIKTQLQGGYCASASGIGRDLKPFADLMASDYKDKVPDGWKLLYERPLGDAQLRYRLYQRGQETVVVFQGVDLAGPRGQVAGEFASETVAVLSKVPSPAFRAAAAQIEALATQFPGLELVGHSKGGGLVRYVSGVTGLPGIAFDPEPVTARVPNTPNVLNVVKTKDFLAGIEKLTGSIGSSAESTIRIGGDCGGIGECHDMTTLQARLDEISHAVDRSPSTLGKCFPGKADRNRVYSCNPRSGAVADVISKLQSGGGGQYLNECVVSNERRIWEEGQNPAIVYVCKGPYVVGMAAAITDWTKTAGFAGVEPHPRQPGKTIVRYEGFSFKAPCVPGCFENAKVPDLTGEALGLCHKPVAGVTVPPVQASPAGGSTAAPGAINICIFGNCPK